MSWFRETMLKAEAKADRLENWVKGSVRAGTDRSRQAADDAVDRTNEFVDDYQDSSDAILDRIPGYTGYKDKERRRDSDRVLRDNVASQLDSDATRVETLQRTAADARNVEQVNALDPVVQGFRNAANLVRTQTYGYSGLFSDRPVDATALNQLRLFDEGLLVKSAALTSAVGALETGTTADPAAIAKQIASFKAGLDLRSQVIDEGRPAKATRIAPVSPNASKAFEDQPGKSAETVDLPEVSLGDAMSILGDDHIVEAIIDVKADDATQQFIRLDNSPQMWIWLSSDPARSPKKLVGAAPAEGVDYASIEGRATISVPGERTRSGPGAIRTGKSSGGSEVVQLDIDGSVQNFTASETHLEDIETYRAR